MRKHWLPAVLLVSISLLQAGQVGAEGEAGQASTDVATEARIVVAPEQTLWRVAADNAPSGTSPWQMLMAIYQYNPKAFKDGHIDQIIPGSRLHMPDLAQIQSQSAQQAESAYKQLIRQASLMPSTVKVSADSQPPAPDTTPEVQPLAMEQPSLLGESVILSQQVDRLQQQLQEQQVQLQALYVEIETLQQANSSQKPLASVLDEAPENLGSTALAQSDMTLESIWSRLISPQFYPWIVATLGLLAGLLLLVLVPVLWFTLKTRKVAKGRAGEPFLSDQAVPDSTDFATGTKAATPPSYKVTSEAEFIAQLLQDHEPSDAFEQASDVPLSAEVDRVLKQKNTAQNVHEPQPFSSTEDEVWSKLDLARSYSKMGHVDQARTLLQEVLHTGNLEQQTTATMLLAKLYQD